MAAQKKTPEQAREAFLLAWRAGANVNDSCAAASRSRKWYENLRSQDKAFAAEVDDIRVWREQAAEGAKDPELYQLSFAEWRKRFLRRETYPHMQNLVDVLEGREPSWIHPAMTYEGASKHRCVINIPPFHAKSQTITVDWVTYKLCMNPNVRIIIVSKKQEFAKKFLFQIKQRLESNLFADLQMAYGGPEGFRGEVWSSNQIYLKGRDADEKDPNVEAVGMGGQIYGSRADIIILDDCIVKSNAGQFESQIDWIQAEVETRVKGGTIALVGTRLNTQDLYSEIIKGERYMSGKSPWTYLAMPMVLEYAENPNDWVTLWPKTHQPMESDTDEEPDENGMYNAWPGPDAAAKRGQNPPRTWELVFQQRTIASDATFHPACVWGSVDKRRRPGPLKPGELGGRRNGMEGVYTTLSVDPAGTGEAFLLMYGVDRFERHRYVLDAWMGTNTKISWYREQIKNLWELYHFQDLVIERQGYSNWLYQDEEIVDFCRQRGIRILPHYTGVGNKVDPDFGVASLDTLFGTLKRRESGNGTDAAGPADHAGDNIIHLPNPDYSPGVRALIDQLLVWEPGVSGSKLRQDGPMALWFAEMRARNIIIGRGAEVAPQNFVKANRFLSARAKRRQVVRPIFTN